MFSNSSELHRLIKAFESEAAKFPDLQFHTFALTPEGTNLDRRFKAQNHAIMLWQYYGAIDRGNDADIDTLVTHLSGSNLKWGIQNCALSLYGVLEGEACPLFVRMASRAAGLFNEKQAYDIRSRVVAGITEREKTKHENSLPIAVVNDCPLAIWLNYLLYHLSQTHPGRERAHKIEPDPFSLSLLALERLASDDAIGKIDRSTRDVREIMFRVAMSFPGEMRPFVAEVVDALRKPLGDDSVFYDHDYQAQLAQPNLDTLLQDIYRNRSGLIVVFLCAEYAKKEWCGLEWRAIRDIIKSKDGQRIMFVRSDDAPVEGVFSIDGYIDATRISPQQVAEFIVERLGVTSQPAASR